MTGTCYTRMLTKDMYNTIVYCFKKQDAAHNVGFIRFRVVLL